MIKNCANIIHFCLNQSQILQRAMAGDLEAIVSIPWDLEGESCSSNVDEELALLEHEETCEDIFPYNFQIAFY